MRPLHIVTRPPRDPGDESGLVVVSVQVHLSGPQQSEIKLLRAVTGGAQTCLAVRVGPTLQLVSDMAALDSLVDAWQAAANLGRGQLRT